MSSVNPCLSYFVHLSSTGEPIPSTMYAVTKQRGQATCKRLIAPVPPYQVDIHRECHPQSGLRYFYKVNKITGNIVPNSMFSMTHKPTSLCSGQDSILEFIVTTPS